MMRSLFSGVTGLRSHQTKMDVVGNNISNVNTLGYKKSVTNFADLYSQNMSIATGPTGESGGVNPRQIGLGTKVNSIVIKHTPGAAQYTGNTLDVAIEGDGFFVLNTPNGERYSRAGDLALDGAGFLVNQSGYRVQCYDSTYQLGTNGRGKASYIDSKNTANIASFKYNDDPTAIKSLNSGTYTFEMTPSATAGAMPDFKVYRNGIDVTDSIFGTGATAQKITFEKYTPGAAGAPGTWGAHAAGTAFDPSTMYRLNVPGIGNVEFTTGAIPAGSTATSFTFDDIMKQIPDVINNGYVTVSNNDGFVSGNKRGDMEVSQDLYTNFAINEKGQLIAQLKEDREINGVKFSKNEQVVLGYLGLATFANNEGLEKVATNLYRSSANSGNAQYGRPGDEGFGALTPSSLEMSNVDLSEEMVNMITTQRGFQANSRIITTSDAMLEELVNLKR